MVGVPKKSTYPPLQFSVSGRGGEGGVLWEHAQIGGESSIYVRKMLKTQTFLEDPVACNFYTHTLIILYTYSVKMIRFLVP